MASIPGSRVEAMRSAETIPGDRPASAAASLLRRHRPGDIGWVISRHAALYAQEYGWDGTFEARLKAKATVRRAISRSTPASAAAA